MFRKGVRRLSCAPLSSPVPILASDVAFLYPRFKPGAALGDSLPEMKHAKDLIASAGRPGANDARVKECLGRVLDIFTNLTPGGKPDVDTPAYLLKDWLAVGATLARHDGLARTPSRDWDRLRLLAPLVQLGRNLPLTDLAVFDALCSVVAGYADAMLRIATYGEGGIGSLGTTAGLSENLEQFRSPDAEKGIVTFGEVCAVVDRLLDAAYAIAVEQQHNDEIRSIRASYSRLCALRALLEIPCTGALHTALEILDRPTRLRGQDMDLLCMIVAMRAELHARLENFSFGMEFVDERVIHDFQLALEKIHYQFPRCKPDGGINMNGLLVERDAYTSISMAKAAYNLGMPKDPLGEAPGVFSHIASRHLSLSPVLLLPSGGPLVVETGSRVAQSSRHAKNRALADAERALKINRSLYPHDKHNLKAGYLLRLCACNYAELKDYIYANGLFNSAVTIFSEHYGEESLEVAETLRWHESYHRFVGSTQEADAQLHRLNYIREQNGLEHVSSLAAAADKPRKGGMPPPRAAQTKEHN